MQKFNRLALPGQQGCPVKGALCCFWLLQDQFFLGFIPWHGEGIQVYTSEKRIPMELIKNFQVILNEQNAVILIDTSAEKQQPVKINLVS